jgi:hypothetical protein
MVRARAEPSGTGVTGSRSAAPRQADPPEAVGGAAGAGHLYDGSDRPNSDSLQRRRSRAKSTDSASTPSVPQAVDSSAALRRMQSLLFRGGGAPYVHVSLVTDGGQGPTVSAIKP